MTLEELKALNNERYGDIKTRHRQGHPESSLQIECVKWFRLQYPWPRFLIAAIPNGGHRDAITAKIMKAEGQWAGLCDLLIPIPRHGYNNLWIEMKNGKKGQLSDHQKETIAFLEKNGGKCVVCRSFEDFVREVNSYLLS